MTVDELEKTSKLFITPAEAATILCCDPQAIRIQARTDPAKLGFPVVVIKTRTRIPRKQFVQFVKGEI